VDVWLWDTVGPGDHCGVTMDETRALKAAEACLTDGQASTAHVELAHANVGGLWIHSSYERTGSGQTATRAPDGSVRWTRFYRSALAAS
jgi:hypothetical protein